MTRKGSQVQVLYGPPLSARSYAKITPTPGTWNRPGARVCAATRAGERLWVTRRVGRSETQDIAGRTGQSGAIMRDENDQPWNTSTPDPASS
jgi:hypothetical protein